jgi:ubiquinone/menaquinone biosynthesis C-methylase UbiE
MGFENSKEETYGDLFTTEKDASRWEKLYKKTESSLFNHNMALRRDRVCQLVLDRYTPDTKILDLGCGSGVVMESLIQQGFSITGVDRSQDMLDLSQKRLSQFPKESYPLQIGSCEHLPLNDEQFDVILCIGVFGYIDDVVGALLEIRRVLRSGGLLVISVRNPFNTAIADPIRALRFLTTKAFYKLSKKSQKLPQKSSENSVSNVTEKSRPPQFRVDILQNPRPLIQGVSRCGYRLDYFAGFGFGPLSIAGKELLPSKLSIAISDFLNQNFDRLGLAMITRSIGDVSIYGFIKTEN